MTIRFAADFGALIKKTRLSQKMTQSTLAAASGTGVRFIVDLERGKPTCALEKALKVMMMLGITLTAEGPPHDE